MQVVTNSTYFRFAYFRFAKEASRRALRAGLDSMFTESKYSRPDRYGQNCWRVVHPRHKRAWWGRGSVARPKQSIATLAYVHMGSIAMLGSGSKTPPSPSLADVHHLFI